MHGQEDPEDGPLAFRRSALAVNRFRRTSNEMPVSSPQGARGAAAPRLADDGPRGQGRWEGEGAAPSTSLIRRVPMPSALAALEGENEAAALSPNSTVQRPPPLHGQRPPRPEAMR